MNDPDEGLMKQLSAGEANALRALMDLHMTALHRAAFIILQDNMAAEDAVQMAFLQLWKIAPNWRVERGTVRAYLYRVTTHRCLDMLRKHKESLPGEMPDIIDTGPTPLDALAHKDMQAGMKTAMAKLPPRQRAALSLFYFQHYSLKQAAKSLDMNPSAFESLLRRARTRLKSLLINLETIS